MSRNDRVAQTHELFAMLQGPLSDIERDAIYKTLATINYSVAGSIARRYANRGIPLEDLQQAAAEGLVKAVKRFDAEKSEDFLTFAVPTIRGEIQRYFRDHGWTVKPPRRVQELQALVNRTTEQFSLEHGRKATDAELCQLLGIDLKELHEVESAHGCFSPKSLDMPQHSDAATTVGDSLASPVDPDVSALEARMTVAPLVRRLPERDRRILEMRFFEDRTQKEIGDELGVTQMQISRLLSRILTDMRSSLTEE